MIITIRIAVHLDSRWSDWFDGLNMHHLLDGTTELSGLVIDQAALYGLLRRAQEMGLTLLTVSVEPQAPDDE